MAKFHVTKAGRTEPCGATKRTCPLGEANHYENFEEAARAGVASSESESPADQEWRAQKEATSTWGGMSIPSTKEDLLSQIRRLDEELQRIYGGAEAARNFLLKSQVSGESLVDVAWSYNGSYPVKILNSGWPLTSADLEGIREWSRPTKEELQLSDDELYWYEGRDDALYRRWAWEALKTYEPNQNLKDTLEPIFESEAYQDLLT